MPCRENGLPATMSVPIEDWENQTYRGSELEAFDSVLDIIVAG